jgi:hypothetical protein
MPLRDIAANYGELSTVFFFPLIPDVKVWHRKWGWMPGFGSSMQDISNSGFRLQPALMRNKGLFLLAAEVPNIVRCAKFIQI